MINISLSIIFKTLHYRATENTSLKHVNTSNTSDNYCVYNKVGSIKETQFIFTCLLSLVSQSNLAQNPHCTAHQPKLHFVT